MEEVMPFIQYYINFLEKPGNMGRPEDVVVYKQMLEFKNSLIITNHFKR